MAAVVLYHSGNLIIALFNLLPILPLDGGSVASDHQFARPISCDLAVGFPRWHFVRPDHDRIWLATVIFRRRYSFKCADDRPF